MPSDIKNSELMVYLMTFIAIIWIALMVVLGLIGFDKIQVDTTGHAFSIPIAILSTVILGYSGYKVYEKALYFA